MSFFDFLNHWWNFPYLVMLGLVAVFFVLQLVGFLAHSDTEIDPEHDVHAPFDHDGGSWLTFFGVGRVPFMIIWVTLFLFAGFTGLFLNRVLVGSAFSYEPWFFPASLGAAFAAGLLGVKIFARLAAKLVDTSGKGASAKRELVGKLGVVASGRLDETFGEVRVHDSGGHEMIVHARVAKGEAALTRADKVLLVDYDEQTELFWATASPVEARVKEA